MKTVGRVTGIGGLIGVMVAFVMLAQGLEGSPVAPNAYDYFGASVVAAMLVSWVTAIYHWATRYPKPARGRSLWGAIIFLGFVLGATVYWIVLPSAGLEPHPSAKERE